MRLPDRPFVSLRVELEERSVARTGGTVGKMLSSRETVISSVPT
jgi:hypothetical protein